MDPFEILGFERKLEIDSAALETAYLMRSRECHPDFHSKEDPEQQLEVVQRAAALNDAYRTLRERWRRAEALIELVAPGELERRSKLSPAFLMQAMELAEELSEAGVEAVEPLRQRVESELDSHFARLSRAVDSEQFHDAAVALHEARYFRKALRDLDESS